MFQHISLVAAREFRQIATTRSFWLTLVILPLMFALGPIASRLLDKSDTESVIVIDQAGGSTATAIRQRVETDNQRATLGALAQYVRRHDLQRADPGAPWAQQDHWYNDAEVARFAAAGGLKTALAAIGRLSKEAGNGFEAPDPAYRVIDTPPALARVAPARLGKALDPYLRPDDKSNRKPVDYVVLVPHDFGASPLIHLWANGSPRASMMTLLQSVVTPDLRARYLASAGVPEAIAVSANTIVPAIQVTTPSAGSGRERILIRSILPLACAYILLMSLVLSGSWMLQGTVEERSNKLLETVLACVSPDELMYGKLAGTVAVGLSMILTWTACGIFAAYATHGAIADMIRPALAPVSSIGSIATIFYFFIAGYLMVSMLFLVIGAVSNSMRDAQGYLMPVILLIMMPFTLLVQAVLRGAGGVAVEVLTWIPLWTPFTVLARLGTGIPAWEVIGSGALLAAFVLIEILLLGRVFRASLLNEGSRRLPEILQLMRRSS